jgi:hypothetical protein
MLKHAHILTSGRPLAMQYSSTFMQINGSHAARELRDACQGTCHQQPQRGAKVTVWYARTSNAQMEKIKLQWPVETDITRKAGSGREVCARCGLLTQVSCLFKPLRYPTNCTAITWPASILRLTQRD